MTPPTEQEKPAKPDEQKDRISIHIDKQQVFAPKEKMTGREIRHLVTPPIGADRDLYLQVPGRGQDQLIGDDQVVELKNGMHFYSAPRTVNPGKA